MQYTTAQGHGLGQGTGAMGGEGSVQGFRVRMWGPSQKVCYKQGLRRWVEARVRWTPSLRGNSVRRGAFRAASGLEAWGTAAG